MVAIRSFAGIAGALALASIMGAASSHALVEGTAKSAGIGTATLLEKAAHRSRYGRGVYGYRAPIARYRYGPAGNYFPSDPREYRAGTLRWWGAMDRLNRGGNPNGGR